MTRDWLVLAGMGVLALLALLLAVVLVRTRSRTRRELATARAETADLRRQLEQIERVLAGPTRPAAPADVEYTITGLGREEVPAAPAPGVPVPTVDRALFADLVLRETVVKAAALAHGVRRALSPATRNRIRFEVRQEVKRARRQRRVDTREAVREWEDRQRAAMAAGTTQ